MPCGPTISGLYGNISNAYISNKDVSNKDISKTDISNEYINISKRFPILLGPIFRPKYGVHLYNSGPNSPPQTLGDERTELFPLVRLGYVRYYKISRFNFEICSKDILIYSRYICFDILTVQYINCSMYRRSI
jgi:hypothetical protein